MTDESILFARVAVDSPLPHLDREFDYVIPEKLRDTVQVGMRVRVPFAGRLLNAVVLGISTESDPELNHLNLYGAAKVPSYTPQAIELARDVATRYAGSVWDVLRLMAPPRVASVEAKLFEPASDDVVRDVATRATKSIAEAPIDVGTGERVVWAARPTSRRIGIPASTIVSTAVHSLAAHPHSSVIVVAPDARAVAQLVHAATSAGLTQWKQRGGGDFAVLDHDDGPTKRYSSYLAAMHGSVRLIVGTRPAVLQPVPSLGLMMVWDEGSDSLQDQHAPYFHARTVAAMRAQRESSALVLGSFAPSVEAAALVAHGFATSITETHGSREDLPAVEFVGAEQREAEGGSGRHWMPQTAWRGLVEQASQGAVAIMVPRAGYVTATACAQCGQWQTCPACEGEIALDRKAGEPYCRDCAVRYTHWHCPECHSDRMAAARQGVEAIAEQLVRMAPTVKVHLSSAASGTIADGTIASGIVVGTPGALPAVEGGYERLVVVSAHAPLHGGLGAELLAARWWLNAASLVRARSDGGRVVLVGDIPTSLRQRIVNWNTWEFAVDAYQERAELGLPPVRRAIAVETDTEGRDAVTSIRIDGMTLPTLEGVTVSSTGYGLVLLLPRKIADTVTLQLRDLVRERSKAGLSPIRVRVDAPL